jgi:hypothetical protein
MTTKPNRLKLTQLESVPSRVAIGTVIGLCLAARPASADQAAQTAQIERFTARPREGALVLTWVVPPATDISRVVIRYRVDGPPPGTVDAGMPLYDEATPPGTVCGTRHSRLSPRHAYAYSAFGLNTEGRIVSTTFAVGTPLAVVPPDTVRNLRRADVGIATSPGARSGR